MPLFLPNTARTDARVMMFIDGENLAIRYKAQLGTEQPASHVVHVPSVMLWSAYASRIQGPQNYIRRYYYTSCQGDNLRRDEIAAQLKRLGIEAPRVFHRTKSRGSKRVDITLATEMLTHAHRRNYDIAVLVAGDEDYVPLVEAVKNEGRQVCVWALSSGLSPALSDASDHFWDIGELLFREEDETLRRIYG